MEKPISSSWLRKGELRKCARPANLWTFSIHDLPIIAWSYGSHDYRLWNSSTSFNKKGRFNKSHINDFCWYTKTSTKRGRVNEKTISSSWCIREIEEMCASSRETQNILTRLLIAGEASQSMSPHACIQMLYYNNGRLVGFIRERGGSISRWLTQNSILLRHFLIFNPEITRCLSTIILLCWILVLLE